MPKERRGLGRGLDALLTGTSGSEAPAHATASVRDVSIDSIRPNPYQPRRAFDQSELAELSASIVTHGLIQPLIVTQDGDGWTLIAGERRLRAAELAGLETVPVIERQADAQQMLAIAIIENVQRSDLDPIEAADAYSRLIDEFGLTQTDVARLVGKSRPSVGNLLRLLNLSEDVRELIAAGHLSEGHGRSLLAIDDPTAQLRLARRVIADGLTVRKTEQLVRQSTTPASAAEATDQTSDSEVVAAPSTSVDPDTAAAVRELEGVLGTKVEIRRSGLRGQVVIHYYSEEELAGLYDRLIGS
jgi:ParB family transcriptional regulator, chromosome partitioning protein